MRAALWWKLGRKGVLTKFIKGVKGIYRNVKTTVKLVSNMVLEKFDSDFALRH
jgi:hypothetical protein